MASLAATTQSSLLRAQMWLQPHRRAARSFSDIDRIQYYELLADELEDADGRTNLLGIFQRDAARYAGTPRGVLSQHWAEQYEITGANLAATWQGTMPAEDVSLISAAEKGGVAAIISALKDLARVGEVIRQSKIAFYSTIAASLVGLCVATAMLLALPMFFAPYLKQTFNFVPAEFYGPLARRYFGFSDFVGSVWPVALGILGAALTWLHWAMPNWTGQGRAWSDEKVLLFRLYRDFRGAMFLAMFASLTKSRAGAVTNQRQALSMMQEGAQPWLAWKISQMIERVDDTGALDASVFDVGIMDRSVFFLLSDIIEARGVSAGLERAGLRSEQRAVKTISARAKVVSWTALVSALLVVLTILTWQTGVIHEFKGAMTTFINSR